jgi:hypothetical protein
MLKNGWTPDDVRVDRTYAALNNLTDWLVQKSKDGERDQAAQAAARAWEMLEATLNTHLGDLTADCAAKLHNNELARHNTPKATSEVAERVIYRLTNGGYTLLAAAS